MFSLIFGSWAGMGGTVMKSKRGGREVEEESKRERKQWGKKEGV
jgi:hypothetical protein